MQRHAEVYSKYLQDWNDKVRAVDQRDPNIFFRLLVLNRAYRCTLDNSPCTVKFCTLELYPGYMSRASAHRLVQKLIEIGDLNATRSGRSHFVVITPQGRLTIERFLMVMVELLEHHGFVLGNVST